MQAQNDIWYFENVDLYKLLCPNKLENNADAHEATTFAKDDFIYFTNDPAKNIYLIAKGKIKIGSYSKDGKEIIKAILSQGEIFGEMGLAGEETRTDFAQALDKETVICPMSIEDMQQLMLQNKSLSFKIFKLVGFKLRKIERRLESLVFKDARTRVVEFIKDMAEERGQKVGFETLVKSNLTHKDIASLTGTSRQTVTTILNELKEKNLITFDRRRILIRDLEKLN